MSHEVVHSKGNINFMIQALSELQNSLKPFLAANPEYEKALEIVQVPERVLQFRVVWEDDQGKAQVNRGFRVQVRTFYISSIDFVSATDWLFASSFGSITLLSDPTKAVSDFTPPSTSPSSNSSGSNRRSRML